MVLIGATAEMRSTFIVVVLATVCGSGAAAECADDLHPAATSSICDLVRDARANPQQGGTGIATTSECTACPAGQYWDPTWSRGCRPQLSCRRIAAEIVVEPKPFATGGVKQIFRGSLRGFPVAVSKSKTSATQEDFDAGIAMLQTLQNHSRAVQLLGFCQDDPPGLSVMVTPLYRRGGAHTWEGLLRQAALPLDQELTARLQAAADFLEA